MDFLYPWLKAFHVLLAVVAVGFNMTYAILIRRAAAEPEHLGHVLRSVKFLDDRFANPAYVLLLIVGLALVWIGGWDITTFWILASLVLYIAVVILGIAAYGPTLRRQIAALEAGGADSADYRALSSRGNLVGAVLVSIVAVIVVLMVVKPTL
jgi:uncharacterized membrane protein